MKKLQPLLCLVPLFIFLVSTRAQVPPAPDSAPTPTTTEAAPQPDDPAKDAEIRKLLELTGTVKMTHDIMEQMISNFRLQHSSVSAEFWDRFEKEMDIQGLVDKIVPVYAKYYTLDDLKAVNAFYETPAGQKVLATMPQVMHESMQIGQDWGRQVAMKLQAELLEEKAKAPAPSSGGQ